MEINIQEWIDKLTASNIKEDLLHLEILHFYHHNPGTIDDIDGIARRLGRDPESVGKCIEDFVKIKLLSKVKVGNRELIMISAEEA